METSLSTAEILRASKRAAETFNTWMAGDLEMVVESVRGGELRLLVKQNCACSLDFSLKEEIESAYRDAGLKVEAEVEGWDVDKGGYKARVKVLGPA